MFNSLYFTVAHYTASHFTFGGTGVNVFRIGNANAADQLQESSLAITDNLNARNTCNFSLAQKDNIRPIVGQEIEVRTAVCPGELQKTIFKGTIDRINEANEYLGAQLFFQVEGVDFNQLADKRLVFKIYENISVKDMILDIVEVFLKDDNITTNGVADFDQVIEKAVFSYVTVAKAFDDISKLTGLHWNIDYDKDLKFFKRSTSHSNFVIDGNTAILNRFCDWLEEFNTRKVQGIKFANFKVIRQREQLTNEQYVIAGKDTTDLRQDEFVGDGERQTFTLRYEIAELKLDADGEFAVDAINLSTGGDQTVGLRDRDEGEVQWLFQKGEKEIIQDEGETPIDSSNTLTVKYKGLRPIIIKSSSGASKQERKNIEQGSSGVYSRVHDDESIEKESYAIDFGNGLIRRYKDIPVIVIFETDQQIFRAGELVDIVLPEYNINFSRNNFPPNPMLIDTVEIADIQTVLFRFTITCLSGEHLGGWKEFYRRLEQFGRQLKLRDQQKLLLISQSDDEGIDVKEEFKDDTPDITWIEDDEICWPVGFAVVGKTPICRAQIDVLELS